MTALGASHSRGRTWRTTSWKLSWRMVILVPASAARPPREYDVEREEEERPPTLHLPYVAGVSEWIMKLCKNFNIRAVFKSGPTLHSLLTKVKDPSVRRSKQTLSMKCHAHVERCTSVRLHIN